MTCFLYFLYRVSSRGHCHFKLFLGGGRASCPLFLTPDVWWCLWLRDSRAGRVIRVPAASVVRRLKRRSSREERGDRRWTARHANGAWQKIARSIDARPRELGLLTFIRSSGRRDRDGRCRTTSTDPARPGRAHGSRTTRTQWITGVSSDRAAFFFRRHVERRYLQPHCSRGRPHQPNLW